MTEKKITKEHRYLRGYHRQLWRHVMGTRVSHDEQTSCILPYRDR